MHLGCGDLFGVWDASLASAAAYAVTARGAAQPAEKLSNTMTTNPDGKPYIHNAEQSEAAKARMTLPTFAPTHSEIAWYIRELTEAKAREANMLDALRLVAKHADFSQCPDGVEEAVDEIMAQHLREGGSPCS